MKETKDKCKAARALRKEWTAIIGKRKQTAARGVYKLKRYKRCQRDLGELERNTRAASDRNAHGTPAQHCEKGAKLHLVTPELLEHHQSGKTNVDIQDVWQPNVVYSPRFGHVSGLLSGLHC